MGTQTSSSSTTATYYRYDTDVTTSTTWDVYPLDLRYSTNCATSLVAYKPVYLVGTVGSDGLFYLDATWWTQTLPSTEDGKVYVYVGETYSTYQIYLASEHTALVYHDGGIKTYQQMLSDEAAKVAGNYITKVGTGDAWVHSEGHGPDANGDATANTYGWRIGSVFELVRAGLSYIRMWVDNSVAKVRVGLESAGHSVFSPDGMEVFTDATTSVAKFGSDGARIGDAEGERFAVRSDRLQAYDEDGELYFEASAERLAYGSSVAASEADVANLDGYVRGYEYVLTTDTVAQEGTAYYSLVDGEYVEFPATAGTTDVTGKYVLSNADSVDGRIAAVDRGYRDAVYAVSLDVDRNDGTIRSLVSALGSGAASVFEQDGDSFTFSLDRAFKGIDDDFKKIRDYVQISGDTLTLGSSSHPVVARLTSTGLTFYPTISPHGEWAVSTAYAVGDKVVHDFAFYECAQAHTSSASSEPGTESGADYWNPVKVERQINYESPIASLVVEGTGEDAQGVLVIHRAVVVNELRLGDWAWMPRGNGNLSLKWIGE